MDNNNNQNNIQQYLSDFYALRKQIKSGDATWRDAITLRQLYNMPEISVDSLRRGIKVFDEYDENSWVVQPEECKDSVSLVDLSPIPTVKETTELLKDGSLSSDKLIDILPENINNPTELLKAHGFNPDEFELVSAKNTKWQQGDKVRYSSKIVVKPTEKIVTKDFITEIQEYFKFYECAHDYDEITRDTYSNYGYNGKSLVFCLFDAHIGREPIYNGKSFEEGVHDQIILYRSAVVDFINKVKKSGKAYEEIVIPIGNDFFNSTYLGMTSSMRNKQTNSTSNYKNIFKAGCQFAIDIISMFSEIAPVEVIYVPGNHCVMEEYFLMEVLYAYFNHDVRVYINNSRGPRSYHTFGTNLIGFAHSSNEGKRLKTLMQNEVSTQWGDTTEHHWIVGHEHHLKVNEDDSGVTIWGVPCVCEADEWTENMGYVTSIRQAMAFIFDKDNGLEEVKFIKM